MESTNWRKELASNASHMSTPLFITLKRHDDKTTAWVAVEDAASP